MIESSPSAATTVLLILGMHRSGTSALTRVLNLLGCALPGDLLGSNESNPRGHWESMRAIEINEALLGSLGRSWNDVRNLPSNWLLRPEAELARRQVHAFVKGEISPGKLWVLKEPRLCRLAPLWIEVFEEEGVDVRVIVPIRHPGEVASSLARRNRMIAERSDLLWIQHVLEAEASTRTKRRVMTHFDELMVDWRAQVCRIAAEIGLEWPNDLESAGEEIDEFLRPELSHGDAQSTDERASKKPVSPIASALYNQLVHLDGERVWNAVADVSAEFARVSTLYSSIMDADSQDRSELVRRMDERGAELAKLAGEARAGKAQIESLRAQVEARDAATVDLLRTHSDELARLRLEQAGEVELLRRNHARAVELLQCNHSREAGMLGAANEQLTLQVESYVKELQIIVNSRSWKITAPLRKLSSIARKRP